MQLTEPANANVTTSDMIRRFGGSTSPSAMWPEDDTRGDDADDRMERVERLLKKTMQKLDVGKRRGAGGSSAGPRYLVRGRALSMPKRRCRARESVLGRRRDDLERPVTAEHPRSLKRFLVGFCFLQVTLCAIGKTSANPKSQGCGCDLRARSRLVRRPRRRATARKYRNCVGGSTKRKGVMA